MICTYFFKFLSVVIWKGTYNTRFVDLWPRHVLATSKLPKNVCSGITEISCCYWKLYIRMIHNFLYIDLIFLFALCAMIQMINIGWLNVNIAMMVPFAKNFIILKQMLWGHEIEVIMKMRSMSDGKSGVCNRKRLLELMVKRELKM